MRKAVIFFVCMVFAVPSVWAGWSGTTADRNISYYSADTKLASHERIVMGPEGNLYCVWRQGQTLQTYEIYFGRSTDNGVTWSSETMDVMISADDGQSVITTGDRPLGMETDSQGNIFIVWVEDLHEAPNDYREVMLLKSTDQGVTWIHSDSDFNISYDGAPLVDASDPDIAVDSDDNLYVVWYQDIAATDTAEIHISISTDAGTTWSGTTADRTISFRSGVDALYPDIEVAPNNDIYVVWREYATPGDITSARIQYGKSTDGGATFNSETADLPISTQIRSSQYPYIVIDDSSNVHVTYDATLASASPFYHEIFYTGSTDGGVTWSGLIAPQYVDFGPDDGSGTNRFGMGITSGGCLVVVWDEQVISMTTNEIWASYSTDGGLTWSGNDEPELISFPDGREGYRPDIIAGAGDTLHAVWEESPAPSGGNYYDIMYSKGDTLTFCGGGSTGPCSYVVGDVNGSDSYNGLDITYGVNYFKGGSAPTYECECTPGHTWYVSGDVNGSCSFNGLDITYGVSYFKGGANPIPCPDCPPN
jgi:Neuraminidase (sialidase)